MERGSALSPDHPSISTEESATKWNVVLTLKGSTKAEVEGAAAAARRWYGVGEPPPWGDNPE
jgi:hypothetical protein